MFASKEMGPKGPIFSMNCLYPRTIHVKDGSRFGLDLKVPCGQCMACRIAKRREWTIRMVHEMDTCHGVGTFLTLTYAEDPGNLNKTHAQEFIRQLREYFPDRKVKYYMCGEYGEVYFRPHYHFILFGISNSDLLPYKIGRHKKSKVVDKLWKYGFNEISNAEWESIQYVAAYVEKKLKGEKGTEEYGFRLPPFSLMSKGIGLEWLKKNEKYVRDNLGITYRGKEVGIPRYYKKKLGLDSDVLFELGKEKREKVHKKYKEIYDAGEDTEKFRRDNASQRLEKLKSAKAMKPTKPDPGLVLDRTQAKRASPSGFMNNVLEDCNDDSC